MSRMHAMYEEERRIVEAMQVKRALRDPLYWMQNMTLTEDKQVRSKDVGQVFADSMELVVRRPFPRKEYFKYVMALLKKKHKLGFWKSRTMMMSWFIAAYSAHLAFTREATEVVVQSADEPKALEFIEKVKVLWTNSHPSLKAMWPCHKPALEQPASEFELLNRSKFIALACGPLGPDKIRSYHPTLYIADEAAFMPELDACIASALGARTVQIILISSANPGPMADMWEDAVEVAWPDQLLEDVAVMGLETAA